MVGTRTNQELGDKLAAAKAAGIAISKIAEDSGVHRSLVSNLCNHGTAPISDENLKALWAWADKRDKELAPTRPEPKYKQALELIHTRSYLEGLGMCKFTQENNGIAVITGKPGTGKTTIKNSLPGALPHPILLEAWPMMRLGDLLNDIAEGLGVRLSGSLTQKTRQIERVLKGSDVTLVIDEAEMLRKWDNDKLEVLRKIWDHTGISIIMFGTPLLLSIVSRMDTTQLSRRMYSVQLKGASAKEVRRELENFNIEDDAAAELARIAADTDRGGMGSFAMMLNLCLKHAAGGRITMQMVNEAKAYKPGL